MITKISRVSIFVFFLVSLFPFLLLAIEEDKKNDIMDMTLEELLNVKIISASKFEESIRQTPATMLVITRKDIEDRGYNSLTDIFYDLPGFDIIVSHGDAFQLAYARGNRTGSFNERTMLLINGVEHNILYTQHMNIDHDFPLTAIERIEILYGPASAVYGANAFSGVINIITRSPHDLEEYNFNVVSRIGLGSCNTLFGELTFLGRDGPWGISLSYRRYRSDRLDVSDRPGFFANHTIIGNPDIWGPFAPHYPAYDNRANNSALLTTLSFKNLEIGFNQMVTNQGNGSVYPYDKTLPSIDWKFFRNVFSIRYHDELSDQLAWTFLTTYQHDGTGPDSSWAQGWHHGDGNSWNDTRTVEMLTWKYISYKWNIYNDIVFSPTQQWFLSGGVKFSSGDYQKSYEFGRADAVTFTPGDRVYDYDQLFPRPLDNSKTPGNNYRDLEWGLYLQIKYSPKKFNLLAGARYDNNSTYGDTFNPRIGATYQVTKNLLLKTNFGTAFQAPAPRNLYGSWGGLAVSANLEPDEIKSLDLSLLYSSKYSAHEITLFYNEIAKSILQGQNLPQKNIFGAEYKFHLLLDSIGQSVKNLLIHFNYTFTNSKFSDPISDSFTGRCHDRVDGIAKHKFNLLLDADWLNHVHLNIKLNYVGKRPTIVSNPIPTIGPYLLTSASIQYKNLFDHVTLYFNVANIFNVDYYHPGYDSASAGEDLSKPSRGWYSSRLPQPGTTFMTGIKIEF